MKSPDIIRSHDLRARNRYRILRTLRQDGPQTRAKLGKATRLSAAALSTLLSEMLEQGYLQTAQDISAPRRGRPQSIIRLDANAAVTATVAMTIDRLELAFVNYNGDVLFSEVLTLDTRSLQKDELIATVIQLIERACASQHIAHLCHISVGIQGVVDRNEGVLLWSPITKGTHVQFQQHIENKFNVATSVNNDCRLIADALHNTESEKLGDSFASVLFSHGVGMGIYFQGKAFSGTQSSALEIGHMQHERQGARCRCGKFGCIEAYTSNYGILRMANDGDPAAEPPGEVDLSIIHDLVLKARQGDTLAADAFSTAGRALGEGLANVFTLLDPMPVALVGHNDVVFSQMIDDMLIGINSIGRSETDFKSLLHCFEHARPLLQKGLSLDSMHYVDRQFANTRYADISDQGVTT